MQKTRAQRTREGQWTRIMDEYRRRHRTWVMQSMPTMSTREWGLYEAWVAGFGALKFNQASRNSRKLRRQLKTARTGGWEFPKVTETVTSDSADAMAYLATRHTRMRFAMGTDYGVGKNAFIKAVRAAGGAPPGRATRQR